MKTPNMQTTNSHTCTHTNALFIEHTYTVLYNCHDTKNVWYSGNYI